MKQPDLESEILKISNTWRLDFARQLMSQSDAPKPPRIHEAAQRLTNLKLFDAINDLKTKSQWEIDSKNVPLDILGRVYQQFLGQKLVITRDQEIQVNEARSHQKSAGIFYSPRCVIEYMINLNLAPKLKQKSPDELKTLSIIDPACGCGAFLIYAYQHLLDWYLQAYLAQDAHHHAQNIQFDNTRDQWSLAPKERIRILSRHIFGLDLDEQAIEIARLSLLRCARLESSSDVSKIKQVLAENIKCGNALIDANTPLVNQLSLQERERLKPFDWKHEFPPIRDQGGFELVLGNPPYRKALSFKEELREISRFEFGQKHAMARMDLWYYFLHRGLQILRPESTLSFIVNAYWTSSRGAKKLIRALKNETHIDEIFLLENLDVFKRVAGQHMILRLTKTNTQNPTRIKRVPRQQKGNPAPFLEGQTAVLFDQKTHQQLFKHDRIELQPCTTVQRSIMEKLEAFPKLGTLGVIRQGIAENPSRINKKTNAEFGEKWKLNAGVFTLSPHEVEQLKLSPVEQGLLRPYFELCDLDRYWIAATPSRELIYSTSKTWPNASDFPALRQHLANYRPIMEKRRETQNGRRKWWQLHWPRQESLWEQPKILALQMAKRPTFSVSLNPSYVGFSVNVFLPDDHCTNNLIYLSALLNSTLLWTWFAQGGKQRGVGLEINGHLLRQAPIRPFQEDEIPIQIIELAQSIVRLQSEKRSAVSANTSSLRQEIAALDKTLDHHICALYGLNQQQSREIEIHAKTHGGE